MGLDRRRHRVFFTRNTEYHLRQDECVGVRDRQTGRWLGEHQALRGRAFDVPPMGEEQTWVGRSLLFSTPDGGVRTSAVSCIERPPRPVVWQYVSRIQAGELRL